MDILHLDLVKGSLDSEVAFLESFYDSEPSGISSVVCRSYWPSLERVQMSRANPAEPCLGRPQIPPVNPDLLYGLFKVDKNWNYHEGDKPMHKAKSCDELTAWSTKYQEKHGHTQFVMCRIDKDGNPLG